MNQHLNSNWKPQTIFTGDCLHVMRGMNTGCVDFIYLDPPFNSNHDYAAPIGSKAAGAAFKDTWGLDDIKRAEAGEIKKTHPSVWALLQAAEHVHSASMRAYLTYMAVRVLEMKRVLASTGTLYLHCDPTAGHYLKLLLDAVFGKVNFRNEVVWHYGKMSNSSRSFPANHDTLFRYSKSNQFYFTPIKGGESEYKNRLHKYVRNNRIYYKDVKSKTDKLVLRRISKVEQELAKSPLSDGDVLFDFDKEYKAQSDVIYVPIIRGNAKERTGYPTQKPVALLEKLLMASSRRGDIVLDPFCGCATTCVAAERLGRQWAGVDLSPKAAELTDARVHNELGVLAWRAIHRTDIPQRTDLGQIPKYNASSNKKYLYGIQEGFCNLCEEHFQARHLEVDHIVPRARGGTDHLSNLQLLCGNCNRRKGTRSQAEAISRIQRQRDDE